MAKFEFTHKAIEDITSIWNYTFENWSEKQADTYYHLILQNCKEVANSPELGKNYSVITEGLLGFKTGRHIIFYKKINDNEVEIIRILHEQMDLKNRVIRK